MKRKISFLLLVACIFYLSELGACTEFEVSFNTEQEVSVFWLGARKLINYFQEVHKKRGLNPEAALKQKAIFEQFQELTASTGTHGSSSSGGHHHGALTSVFSTLKGETSNMNETQGNLFLLKAMFEFLSTFLEVTENAAKNARLDSKEREFYMKVIGIAKEKNKMNLDNLNAILKEGKHITHKFIVKISPGAPTYTKKLELTKIKNSLTDENIIIKGITIKPGGNEIKGSFEFPTGFVLEKSQEKFNYEWEGARQFIIINEKGGKKRRVRFVDEAFSDSYLSYDIEIKVDDMGQIEHDLYLHQILEPDAFDLLFTGSKHGGIGAQSKSELGSSSKPISDSPRMTIVNVKNRLKTTPITIQKDGYTHFVKPGEDFQLNKKLPLALIFGGQGGESYILTDEGSWCLKVRNIYFQSLTIMDVVWRDRNSTTNGQYDIEILYDESIRKVWFKLSAHQEYHDLVVFEFSFDGSKNWDRHTGKALEGMQINGIVSLRNGFKNFKIRWEHWCIFPVS